MSRSFRPILKKCRPCQIASGLLWPSPQDLASFRTPFSFPFSCLPVFLLLTLLSTNRGSQSMLALSLCWHKGVARPHAMNQLHLSGIRFVQNRIIQHQYSGAQLDLRFHLKPKGNRWKVQAAGGADYRHHGKARRSQRDWFFGPPSPSHSPAWQQRSR